MTEYLVIRVVCSRCRYTCTSEYREPVHAGWHWAEPCPVCARRTLTIQYVDPVNVQEAAP